MSINDKPTTNKKSKTNSPVTQQFASGGSAVPTTVPPYDVERISGEAVDPAPKPESAKPSK